jgi:predicted regulator of Ras-like GTPase activity (Roadblock/LC7/MglB family)
MSKDAYAAALKTALAEIKKVCPGIKSSFIFTKEGTIVAGDSEASTDTKRTLLYFQNVREKADAIGGILTLSVNGTEGDIQISQANDMYLTTATSKGADTKYLLTITGVIVPTILKLLKDTIQAPTPLKAAPSQQLTAKKITGFFVGDASEVDQKILTEWSDFFKGKTINVVEIQAPNGKKTRCKVKAMDDERLEGKGFIRMPEKTLKMLKVGEEEVVTVKPITP